VVHGKAFRPFLLLTFLIPLLRAPFAPFLPTFRFSLESVLNRFLSSRYLTPRLPAQGDHLLLSESVLFFAYPPHNPLREPLISLFPSILSLPLLPHPHSPYGPTITPSLVFFFLVPFDHILLSPRPDYEPLFQPQYPSSVIEAAIVFSIGFFFK